MAGLTLRGVGKCYVEGQWAVRPLDLEIDDGEFMVLVGPSGCGKSTLLRMIAGLEATSAGAVFVGERDVTDVPPQARDVAMVFQSYALYPQMSVRQNLAFPLKLKRMPKAERERRIAEAARALGIEPLLERKPGQLSGGERQRVAMGRAMVREPQAFLMDEPLSNLDAKLRVEMRTELARRHRELRTTTVYVTHDQTEAMTLGERVAVMREGAVMQCGSPRELFDSPANAFVGTFIGSPVMNLVLGSLRDGRLSVAGIELPVGRAPRGERERVVVGIRPCAFGLPRPGDGEAPRLRVVPDVVEELGTETHLTFPLQAPRVDEAAVGVSRNGNGLPDPVLRMTAAVDDGSDIAPGDAVELTLSERHMHLFDPETGVSLAASR